MISKCESIKRDNWHFSFLWLCTWHLSALFFLFFIELDMHYCQLSLLHSAPLCCGPPGFLSDYSSVHIIKPSYTSSTHASQFLPIITLGSDQLSSVKIIYLLFWEAKKRRDSENYHSFKRLAQWPRLSSAAFPGYQQEMEKE